MSGSMPFIIFDDNLIFSRRFKYVSTDKPTTEIFNIEFFITPYGLFIPTEVSEFGVLAYLKNPTPNNYKKIDGFKNRIYLVTSEAEIVVCILADELHGKIFTSEIPSGKGVKSIHNTGTGASENKAVALYASEDYESFIALYDAVIDPHRSNIRMKIQDIADMLKAHNATLDIRTTDLKLTNRNIGKIK